MPGTLPHYVLRSWLASFGDAGPNGAHTRPAAISAARADAQIEAILAQAQAHGVLMALARKAPAAAARAPRDLFTGTREQAEEAAALLAQRAQEAYLPHLARNMKLDNLAKQIDLSIARAGLPAVIIKGPDFANAAYGGIQARSFSDIDILAAPHAAAAVGDHILDLGFSAVEPPQRRQAYAERQFVLEDAQGNVQLIEVHTDLVHAPKLRRSMSLTYADYADPANGGVTMASRLVLAALHGATSHLFDQLRYVVDMAMIARAGVDRRELARESRAQRRANTASHRPHPGRNDTGMPRGSAVAPAHQTAPGRSAGTSADTAAGLFLAQTSARGRASWRRQAYRWLLDRQAPLPRRTAGPKAR